MAKILVVDDDPDIVRLLTTVLSRDRHTVHAAMDTLQATMLAQQVKPDLVIMDFQMPAGTGDELLSRLRASSHTMTVPVILLSSLPVEQQIAKITNPDGVRFLQKPVRHAELLELVQALLGR